MPINARDARVLSDQCQFTHRLVPERSCFSAPQRGSNVRRHQLSFSSSILGGRSICSFTIGTWNFCAVAESPDSRVPYHLATGVDFDSVMLALLTRKLFNKRVGL